ncbi:MAG: hypothetical protein HY825_18685 [Acidobacteria bacterium]|nr:hypothetical protein [Acidobacteriota bacterium]
MNIYLAAAMTNPTRDLPVIGTLLARIEASGMSVPTRHVAEADGRKQDARLTDAELAKRDLTWIEASDALVAEVTTPSHGVGIEVLAATQRGMPVLLLYREDIAVSRLLLGLPGTQKFPYASVDQACQALEAFLADVAAARPARTTRT